MFTDRQFRIIACLSSADSWMKGDLLASAIGVSNRTLQVDIKKINEQVSGKAKIISNNRLGYSLEDPDGAFYTIINEKIKKEINPQGIHGHARQITVLLLFEKDYISIGNIADRLYFSKSTINTNLPQVRRVMERTPDTRFLVSAQKGIYISAPENTKRIMCMKSMEKKVDYAAILRIKEFENIYIFEEKLYPIIAKLLTDHALIVTGEAFKYFIKYLAISIFRSQLGYYQEMPESNMEIQKLVIDIVKIVEEEIHYRFTNDEIQYIEARIRELNLIQKYPVEDRTMIEALEKFEKDVWIQTGCKLEIEKDLRETMADHIIRMKQRVETGRNNFGNHTKELFFRYPLELHLLKTCLCPVLGFDIPDAELGYMILYLAAVIDKSRKKLKVLIVSDSSAGSIYNLERLLRYYIIEKVSEIQSIPMYLFQQKQEEYQSNYQIYITTESELALQCKKFWLINEFPMPSQLEQIHQKVYEIEKKRTEKANSRLFDQYLLPKSDEIQENNEITLDSLLYNFIIKENHPVISIESIGNNVLCMISHSLSGKNTLIKFADQNAMVYKGKQITEVVMAHYGGEGDIIEFFDFLKEVLSVFIREYK